MYSRVGRFCLGGVGFADVCDMWIELCWEIFMKSRFKEESSSMSSKAIGSVMVFSVGVGGVGWGSCINVLGMCGIGCCGGRAMGHGGIVSVNVNLIVLESV